MRLLIVEDDPRLAAVLARGLRENGYAVDRAADGGTALEHLHNNEYDAVVLDLMIPGIDGMEVCRRLRAERGAVPVLMLTARDSLDDRVRGLDAGADDYLTKPFAFAELLARLRALMRRGPAIADSVIRAGEVQIDTRGRRVMRGQYEVPMTSKEYALLEYLARHAGRVVGREEIAEHVWDERYDPFSNVIDVYVNRLRKKVGPELIVTRRSEGYMLRP